MIHCPNCLRWFWYENKESHECEPKYLGKCVLDTGCLSHRELNPNYKEK